MAKITRIITVFKQKVIAKIYFIRDKKGMLDYDLAEMYGVETKQLNRQVKRNVERFPKDFMYQLTTKEYNSLRSQFGTLNPESIVNICLWLSQNLE